MLRNIIIIFLNLIVIDSAIAQDFTFRGLLWNSSESQIIEKEGSPSKRTTSDQKQMFGEVTLSYESINVAGYDAIMEIEIGKAGIIAGTYSFSLNQEEFTFGLLNPQEHVNAYVDLIQKLTSLYGTPIESNSIDKLNERPSMLSIQNLQNSAPLKSVWEFKEGGAIYLVLSFNQKWNLILAYISPTQYDIIKKMQEAQANNKDGL
ncbi:hypothetical protein [Spirochaeta lutea]|uniref:Uncharacterized protein n=1 Tax=Spirochaeta lutea TaxID=1480694 RepID=A0A098R1J4_9SPIO|nr:hypothetical protein [Spirochaeta lutea]KGE73661.1 hypothetical protein DC28_01615 [Spirochaeta lutea]